MSWGIRVIGKDRGKVKEVVHKQLTQYAYPNQPHSNDEVARAIAVLMDCFPKAENFAVYIKSSGHIEPNGYGNATIEITTIPPNDLADDLAD